MRDQRWQDHRRRILSFKKALGSYNWVLPITCCWCQFERMHRIGLLQPRTYKHHLFLWINIQAKNMERRHWSKEKNWKDQEGLANYPKTEKEGKRGKEREIAFTSSILIVLIAFPSVRHEVIGPNWRARRHTHDRGTWHDSPRAVFRRFLGPKREEWRILPRVGSGLKRLSIYHRNGRLNSRIVWGLRSGGRLGSSRLRDPQKVVVNSNSYVQYNNTYICTVRWERTCEAVALLSHPPIHRSVPYG